MDQTTSMVPPNNNIMPVTATVGGNAKSSYTKMESTVSTATTCSTGTTDSDDQMPLLPELRRAFPTAVSYNILQTIVQSNAVGYKLNVQLEDSAENNNNNNEVNVFLKQVQASEYVSTKKDWTDLRRTLLYARTETRFYSQILPLLQQRGFCESHTPRVYLADYDLENWIDENEIATTPANTAINKDTLPNANQKGGILILECISDTTHYQDSPLTLEESKTQCLEAVAQLHASAWEDTELLEQVESKLSKASFHLQMRNPKELDGIVQSWTDFCTAFEKQMDDSGLRTPSVLHMATRIEKVAKYVSEQVSPSPNDPYATIIHGDYKSMNAFMAKDDNDTAVMVDFASCGIGLGMSDLAMHIRHAVLPEHLENGGEEAIVKHYWEYLVTQLDGPSKNYPWDVAWKHYKIAVVDYFRFFMARMWKSATPTTMEKKSSNKNVSLINRSIPSAMAFIRNVDHYLAEVEEDYANKEQKSA